MEGGGRVSGGSWLACLGGVFRGWDQPSRLLFENEWYASVLVVETVDSKFVLFNVRTEATAFTETFNSERGKNT